MKGKIGTTKRCPSCGGKFAPLEASIDFTALICPKCKTHPTRFYIDLYWKGKRLKISRDKYGDMLSSIEQANRLRTAIRQDIDNHCFDPSKYERKALAPFKFRNFAAMYLKDSEQRARNGDISQGTVVKREGIIRLYLMPFFGNEDIRDIRALDVQTFRNEALGSVKPSYAAMILKHLKIMLNWAHKLEMIERIPLFPSIKQTEKAVEAITPDIQDKIIGHIPAHHQPIFRFMAATGCRPSEARALKWDCVDRDAGTITFRRSFWEGKLQENTKNRKERLFPITRDVAAILDGLPRNLTGFVFIQPSGKPYRDHGPIWRKACKKVGVKIKPYNGTRHSFFSNMADAGVPIDDLTALAGNSREIARRHYVKVNVQRLGKVLDMVRETDKEKKIESK